jgi:hypothetical protein
MFGIFRVPGCGDGGIVGGGGGAGRSLLMSL